MSLIRERLPQLLEARKKHLAYLELNVSDPTKDKGGSMVSSLALTYRFLAVSEFCVNGDISLFRDYMNKSALARLSIYQRSMAGEDMLGSYLSMVSFKSVLDALAGSNFDLAVELSKVIGGREKIESENDSVFIKCFGYLLKSFILRDESVNQNMDCFSDLVTREKYIGFKGYSDAFKALMGDDEKKFAEALILVDEGHKILSKGKGLFAGDVDEVLCVWGVGIANLAIHRGLKVDFDSDLIPRALFSC